jgi:uncharacterized protein
MTRIPVCIFAKPPVPGCVKTRLAEAIGAVQAAKLASAMLCDVWTIVKNVAGVVPVLAATEAGNFGIDVAEETTWLQPPGELGQRIECILQRALKAATAAIALGADTPLITVDHLHEAIQDLESGDAVLGPSEDGGFYLLGLHSCPPGLLAGIAWSSEHTLSQTENRLRAHRMKVARISSLLDVDTVSELEQLRYELVDLPPEIAPMTRKWLEDVKWSAL